MTINCDFCSLKEIVLHIQNEEFQAGIHRCLFHKASKTLLVADCHFGKITHFRKNAIPISHAAAARDYELLIQVLLEKRPQKVIFMGDLFHSATNAEWDWLASLIQQFKNTLFVLIQGNHDILPKEQYQSVGITVETQMFFTQDIVLTHEPVDFEVAVNVCGHVHPGIGIKGKAKQHLSLPCYFQTNKRLYMPSFGKLTGHINMAKIEAKGKAYYFTPTSMYATPIVL